MISGVTRRLAAAALVFAACTPSRATAPEVAPVVALAAAEPVAAEPATVEPVAAAEAEAPAEDERCRCPAPGTPAPPRSAGDEGEDEGEDEDDLDRRARRARAKKTIARALAARLKAALPDLRPACDVALAGPCSLRADLDGDGGADEVILVRGPGDAGGIAILWAHGAAEVLGAGRGDGCWRQSEVPGEDEPAPEACAGAIDADLGWIAGWGLWTRKSGEQGPIFTRTKGIVRQAPAPGARGDGLHLSGSDAAAVLYRDADGWVLMHLGF